MQVQCKCNACAERDLQRHDVSGLPKRSLAGALSSQGCAASLILEADGRHGARSACSADDCPQARHGSTTPWAECGRTSVLEAKGPAERHPVVDGSLLRKGPVQGRHAHPSCMHIRSVCWRRPHWCNAAQHAGLVHSEIQSAEGPGVIACGRASARTHLSAPSVDLCRNPDACALQLQCICIAGAPAGREFSCKSSLGLGQPPHLREIVAPDTGSPTSLRETRSKSLLPPKSVTPVSRNDSGSLLAGSVATRMLRPGLASGSERADLWPVLSRARAGSSVLSSPTRHGAEPPTNRTSSRSPMTSCTLN